MLLRKANYDLGIFRDAEPPPMAENPMARKSLWVGLDVGADQTTVCATDDSRAVLYEVPIAKNPAALHAVLKRDKRRISLIGLESGSFAIVLYRYLVKLGYIVDLDRRLAQRAKEDPVCQRFLEIPGVGPITALAFYSAVDDPYRFRRSTDIGAYFGLVPRVRQSGQRLTRTRITKSGDRLTRTYLTSAAQHHLRTADSSLTRWGTALS